MEEAYFAGGCFWCIAAPFYDLPGVSEVTSGYCGEDSGKPDYLAVKKQQTGYRETLRILYDPAILSYGDLLSVFLDNIDPYDGGGQFIDRGRSYTTAIFPKNTEEMQSAILALEKLSQASGKEVRVSVEPLRAFYEAEEEHQNYSKKHPREFAEEIRASGRKEESRMLFDKKDRIVFAGDSVTDMGSAQPVGEGLFDSLGNSYVRAAENMLYTWYPDFALRITNSGISGNTSRDLLARWERDVLNLNPDWVSIMIGINDVWRQFDCPGIPELACSPEEYEDNLTKMIESVRGRCKGIIIMTPYYMEPLREDPMRARMDQYGAVCKKLAEKYGTYFIDLQAVFDRYFTYRHSSFIAWDRIHPNRIGAELIARTFLETMGFDFTRKI